MGGCTHPSPLTHVTVELRGRCLRHDVSPQHSPCEQAQGRGRSGGDQGEIRGRSGEIHPACTLKGSAYAS